MKGPLQCPHCGSRAVKVLHGRGGNVIQCSNERCPVLSFDPHWNKDDEERAT